MAPLDVLVLADPFRQIAPARPGAGHPQQGVDEPPAVTARPPLALPPARNERLDPLPLIGAKNSTFQGRLQKAALNQNSPASGIPKSALRPRAKRAPVRRFRQMSGAGAE